MGRYLFNDDKGRLEIRNADDVGLAFSSNLPSPRQSGSVSVTFYPTKVYPKSGWIGLLVSSTSGDGYKFVFPRAVYKTQIFNIVEGKDVLVWDRNGDSFGLNQEHTATLTYSPERVVCLFDGVKIFDVRNSHQSTVDTFCVWAFQMDCYITRLSIE